MSNVADLPAFDLDALPLPAVHFSYARDDDPWLRRAVIRTVELLTGQPRLRRHYEAWSRSNHGRETIFDAGLRLLNIPLGVSAEDAARIPASGPLLVVANHPFGVADGLALGALLTRVRPDVKLLCHSLLCQPRETQRYLLPIDFGGTAEARATSAASRVAAREWLRQGHCLAVFPAGGVATRQAPLQGRARELPWHVFTARLATTANTRILPVRFAGENSTLFHLASHRSYALRIALMFRETLRRTGQPLDITVGEARTLRDITTATTPAGIAEALHRDMLQLGGQEAEADTAYYQWPAHIAT